MPPLPNPDRTEPCPVPPVHTRVELAGISFKSPLLVSSSEWTAPLSRYQELLHGEVGGIVTKTFTSAPENRIRLRPYQFPLDRFGRVYREAGCLISFAAPHVEDMASVFRHLPAMAKACHHDSQILIASFFEDPGNDLLWVERAKAFQEAGADMVELNFSSPSATHVFSRSAHRTTEIIERLKKDISIPLGAKIGPSLEPLEDLVQSWTRAGLDFVTAHNAPAGIFIDVETMTPFGAPAAGGYVLGRPFLPYSLARVLRIKRAAEIPVIGVGGVYDSSDALQYLLCGCHLVGVGSALYFKGPRILNDIHHGITQWMERKGYLSVDAFRGHVLPMFQDSSRLKSSEPYPFAMPPLCPYLPVIDDERCNRCGACVRTCIYGVFSFSEKQGKINAETERCWSCGFCVGICPLRAIELRERWNPEKVIWNNQGVARPFVRAE